MKFLLTESEIKILKCVIGLDPKDATIDRVAVQRVYDRDRAHFQNNGANTVLEGFEKSGVTYYEAFSNACSFLLEHGKEADECFDILREFHEGFKLHTQLPQAVQEQVFQQMDAMRSSKPAVSPLPSVQAQPFSPMQSMFAAYMQRLNSAFVDSEENGQTRRRNFSGGGRISC